ncbi:MAG TPA: alpha/beta hydrolase [Polyangiaceae bacterium]|nr:alpha/beta hydrolase [Polyangiaceae bacterium]
MRVNIGDTRLFFEVEGFQRTAPTSGAHDRPTLLLLHGGPGLDHMSFRPDFSALSRVAQVVYLDQRGQGQSDRSSAEHWHLAQWAEDVKKFCDVLGIERPVVLGTSFGGFVAMTYAIRYPDHPAKLILSSTSARGSGGATRRARIVAAFERLGGADAGAIAKRALEERTPEAFAAYVRVCGPLYTRRGSGSDARQRPNDLHEVLAFFERANGEGATFDFLSDLSRIRCPTLVMGGEDDPMTPIAEQEDIAAALPRELARFERFPRCGHGVWRDAPERAFSLIGEFLQS